MRPFLFLELEIPILNLVSFNISAAAGAIFSLLAQRKDPKERAPRSLGPFTSKGLPSLRAIYCGRAHSLLLGRTFAHIPVRSTPINYSPLGKLNGAEVQTKKQSYLILLFGFDLDRDLEPLRSTVSAERFSARQLTFRREAGPKGEGKARVIRPRIGRKMLLHFLHSRHPWRSQEPEGR